MTTPRQRRLAGSFGWDPSRRAVGSLTERLLVGIGADPAFTDDLLGDLAEERARRAAEHGAVAAGAWYLAEAVRAVPHLAWNAVRHGGSPGRMRVASIVGVVMLVPALVVTVIVVRAGTPVRLVVEGQRGRTLEEGLIVNSRHPVGLTFHAFDARGHAVGPDKVHFRWMNGDPLDVTPNGVVTCAARGDSWVQASAGRIATVVRVQCRPVRRIRTYASIQFVAGDSAFDLGFEAESPDGGLVWELAGERFVEDTTVARLDGYRLIPLRPGHTEVVVRMGDAEASTGVSVLEPVPSFEHLRPEQREVIAPVHLAPGDTIRWPLPEGTFALYYRRESRGPMPDVRFTGPVMCLPDSGPRAVPVVCLVRGPGAGIRMTSADSTVVSGRLAFERTLPYRRL